MEFSRILMQSVNFIGDFSGHRSSSVANIWITVCCAAGFRELITSQCCQHTVGTYIWASWAEFKIDQNPHQSKVAPLVLTQAYSHYLFKNIASIRKSTSWPLCTHCMSAALRCDKFSEACSTAHCNSAVPAHFATVLLLWLAYNY